MKFSEVLVLSLSVVLFTIGLHQLYLLSEAYGFSVGLGSSYGFFMLSGACFLAYRYLKSKPAEKQPAESKTKSPPKPNRKNRRKKI